MTAILLIFPTVGVAASKDVKQLNRHLASTPMRGTGKVIVKQARIYGINPYFVAAVAAKESSLGEASCYGNPKNIWGLGACGRVWTPPQFSSWTQAINYFVRFIDRRWPNANNPFEFYGYCNGCEHEWATDVSYYMRKFGGGTQVR